MSKISDPHTIELCKEGLSLLPIGSTLPSHVIPDLCGIDNSTFDGNIEQFLVSESHHDHNQPYFNKKLKEGKYSIGGLTVKSILVGYSEFAMVKTVIVRLRNYDFISTKLMLDSVYGEVKDMYINHKSHQQVCVWSCPRFDVVFCGLSGLIKFYYTSSSVEMKSA